MGDDSSSLMMELVFANLTESALRKSLLDSFKAGSDEPLSLSESCDFLAKECADAASLLFDLFVTTSATGVS